MFLSIYCGKMAIILYEYKSRKIIIIIYLFFVLQFKQTISLVFSQRSGVIGIDSYLILSLMLTRKDRKVCCFSQLNSEKWSISW